MVVACCFVLSCTELRLDAVGGLWVAKFVPRVGGCGLSRAARMVISTEDRR